MYTFKIYTNVKFTSFSQFNFIVTQIMRLYDKWLKRKELAEKYKPYIAIERTVFAVQNDKKGTNREMNWLTKKDIFCGWVYEYDKSHSHRRWRYKFLLHKGNLLIMNPNTKIKDFWKEVLTKKGG